MRLLKDIFYLFFPKLCETCQNPLVYNETLLCLNCRHDLPIICYTNFTENNISNIFKGKVPVNKVVSFLYYRKIGKTKELIHQLKYKGKQEIGGFIANWFGKILWDSKEFNDIDYIIPVPLHPKKQRQRGYNQLTTFGRNLSKQLQTNYLEKVLIRSLSTKTQTFKSRLERFDNTNTKFLLKDYSLLQNKHVLLIDDVITTGATLEACCKELLKSDNITISIATIAFTE